jgi:hypothetical protein
MPTANPPPDTALIACRVLEAEIEALSRGAAHIVRREFFEIGLHDQPTNLRSLLADAVGRAEDDPTVRLVVLVYGLCGLALVGISPRRCPLVVARAHDCITLFLGSKERYGATMRDEPGTYWYSPGWNKARRVPGPEREAALRKEYTAKFGAEDAEALLEMERAAFAQHTTAGYADLGLPGDEESRRYAEQCARSLGWRFRGHPGDPSLLHDLLHGPWDNERFLTVRPGERIAHSADADIVKAVPAKPEDGGHPAGSAP